MREREDASEIERESVEQITLQHVSLQQHLVEVGVRPRA